LQKINKKIFTIATTYSIIKIRRAQLFPFAGRTGVKSVLSGNYNILRRGIYEN